MDEMHNSILEGYTLSVGWSRAIKTVALPNDTSHHNVPSSSSLVHGKSDIAPFESSSSIQVLIPQKDEVKKTIDLLAQFVATDGDKFENEIKEKERNNEQFSFLFDVNSPLHHYYQWRIYANLMGDGMVTWNTKPFQLTSNGPFW